jgi:GNAT superfamily N-acetyltransferase
MGEIMNISLFKAGPSDAKVIYEMQIKSFMPLLDKYQDFETSPANEPISMIVDRINQSFTDYYIIKADALAVGAIRVVKNEDNQYRISPIFILPEYQGKGIAQRVFHLVEEKYEDAKTWELDTILQEKGNIYLYEKLGYKRIGGTKEINDKMTIVFYEKNIDLE